MLKTQDVKPNDIITVCGKFEVMKAMQNLQPFALHNNIKVLELFREDFEIGGYKLLSEALKANTSLNTLSLANTKIDAEKIKELSAALKVNKSISYLLFNYLTLGPEGTKTFCEALKMNTGLTHLVLGINIELEGVKSLSEALKVNKTLEKLEFLDPIGTEGIISIAKSLKTNHTLTLLNFRSGPIDSEAAKALTESLKVNNSLIYLSGNYNGDPGVFLDMLKVNYSITRLKMEWEGENLEKIQTALESNKGGFPFYNKILNNWPTSFNKVPDPLKSAILEFYCCNKYYYNSGNNNNFLELLPPELLVIITGMLFSIRVITLKLPRFVIPPDKHGLIYQSRNCWCN